MQIIQEPMLSNEPWRNYSLKVSWEIVAYKR